MRDCDLLKIALAQLEQSRLASIAAIEGAVIIEAEYQKFYHEIWWAQLPKEVALERLLRRNPELSQEDANKRLDNQISDEERKKYCGYW